MFYMMICVLLQQFLVRARFAVDSMDECIKCL